MNNISKPIIFGASGFIGQHFIREVGLDRCIPVTRTAKDDARWLEADLLRMSSIELALKQSNMVVNLAYSQQSSPDDNIKMARNLAHACYAANIKTLVYCSTAIVVGNNSSLVINEDSLCFPETIYEKTKYKIERIFLEVASDKLKVFILRPTGVIGPGGQNLKKMLSDIKKGNAIINYLRSSLYGDRPLNLVSVKDVSRALLHLLENKSLKSGIFICSADDDLANSYDQIESIIRTLLQKQSPIKPVKLPCFFLHMLLRMARRGGGCHVNRRYSSEKLFSTGFKRSMSLTAAVKDFVLSEGI